MPDSNWPQFLNFTKKLAEASKNIPETKKEKAPKKAEKEDNLDVLESEFVQKVSKNTPEESYYIVGERKLTNILAILSRVNAKLIEISKEQHEQKKRISEMEKKIGLKEQMDELKSKMNVLKKEVNKPVKKKKK